MEQSASRGARRSSRRPSPRPERQQIMLRRLLALGAALVVLILIVLGVKGCLDARARSALSDYSRSVSQIVTETQQTSTVRSGGVSETATESVTHTLEQENYGVARMNDEKETCVDTESGAQAGNSTWVRPSQDVRWLD